MLVNILNYIQDKASMSVMECYRESFVIVVGVVHYAK